MKPLKAIKLANGARLTNGQLFLGKEKPMTYENRIGRDGAPKNIVDAPIKPGMVRATKGDLHPYLHGQAAPLDDTPNTPNLPEKSHLAKIPVHDGMSNHPSEIDPVANDPGEILRDAENFGRPRRAQPGKA